MTFKIGVYGSGAGDLASIRHKAVELGEALARKKVILITGACSGLPYMVAHKAAKLGAEVWGYSPEVDLENQKRFVPEDDLSIYKNIFYIPENFPLVADPKVNKKYRNVISTANADAGIIVSGRWGSLNEFTNLIDMGKIVGVLTGTGGIADELPKLSNIIKKEGGGKVIFNNSPIELVEKMMYELSSKA